MVTNAQIMRSDFSRVWVIPFTAGPSNVPIYEGLARAGTPAWTLGDITSIYVPDPDQYGNFLVAGKVKGDRSLPTLNVIWRYPADARSVLERLVKSGCDHDIQVHMGDCQNPQDFNGGWHKILVLQRATPTSWGATDLGALQPSERALVDEELPFVGEDIFHIYRIIYEEQAAAQVVQEIVDIAVCDAINCGACGLPSNGCDKVFALTLSAGGSPGLPAEIIFSDDGGETYDDTNITTLAANENPDALTCVGSILVVVSEDSESLHWADLAEILAGTETWQEVTTGFVAGNGPLAIHSESPVHTWIVGESGYVYFSDNPRDGVTVQNAGIATTSNLNAVHAYDINNVIAVGNNDSVIVTRNGGDTWSAIAGPPIGVTNLNTVFMRGVNEWFVGTAGGQLFYTRDAGASWTQKTFSGSGAGQVRHIIFSNPTVGWMAHDNATPAGRILRTIDGGNSWYITPEGNTLLPTNDRINALAICHDPNVIYGGGLGANGIDGFIVKGA